MRQRLLSNFDKELLKDNFKSKLEQVADPYEAIMSAIDDIVVEVWRVKRYDQMTSEFIFENVDTGISKPECCMDNQYIKDLFEDYIDQEMVKPDDTYIQIVKDKAKLHIMNNLKRIFEEQIGLAKLKVKPSEWHSDKKTKYTVRTSEEFKKFIVKTVDIAHEDTWVICDEENLADVNESHDTYYFALNWSEITLEAQTRALRQKSSNRVRQRVKCEYDYDRFDEERMVCG